MCKLHMQGFDRICTHKRGDVAVTDFADYFGGPWKSDIMAKDKLVRWEKYCGKCSLPNDVA